MIQKDKLRILVDKTAKIQLAMKKVGEEVKGVPAR